jgi:predicted outer membrane repeat protein
MSRNFPREVSRLFAVRQCRHRKKEFRARRRPFWALEGLEHRVLLAGPDIFMVVDNSLSDAERGSLTNALALADHDPNPDGAYVEFDPSIYNASNPFNITLTSTLVLSNTAGPEEILNLGGGNVTINGGGTTGVFQIEKGVTATLSNMTITGGFESLSSGQGGGIAVEAGASLDLNGSTIEDNTAGSGGGIADAGVVTISQSNVLQNFSAGLGGGVDIEPRASLAVSDDSEIEDNSAFAGGGIANAGSLTISQSSVNQNSAVLDGGAVYSSGTLVDVEHSMILENHSSKKGGAGIVSIGTSLPAAMIIAGSVISGNTAGGGAGAGVYDAQCKLTITDSTIANNSGATSGGGIAVSAISGLNASVTDSTISGNKAAVGGGILVADGVLTITGSTISGNTATSDGGGVAGTAAAVTIGNSTIAANSAATGGGIDIGSFLDAFTIYDSTIAYNVVAAGPGSGGGIDSAAGSTTNSATVLYNTIVAMNTDGTGAYATADDIAGAAVSTSSQYNLVGADETGSMADGSDGNQVGVVDPGLDLLSSSNGGTTQTIALLPGSPAINAGDTSVVPGDVTTDQRGFQRVFGPSVDIGAYESDSTQVGPLITFGPIADQVYHGVPITLTLNASDSGTGQTVAFSIISGPATVSGNLLTVTGGGQVVVEASQAGPPTYPPSPVEEAFTVIVASVYSVDATTDTGSGSGNEGDLLYCITQANNNTNPDGSVIEFDPSIFIPNNSYTITLTSTLELTETGGPEVIEGAGASVVTISGGGTVGVFEVTTGVTATLSGLTISGGSFSVGGGLWGQEGSTVKVSNSLIQENYGSEGGGVFAGGSVTIANSTISNNSAIFGGGILISGSALTISDSALSANSASSDGGGVYESGGTSIVINSTIADNTASAGGGICNVVDAATLIDSTIAGNSASVGGGIDSVFGTVTAVNTTMAFNEVFGGSGAGGGIDSTSGTTVKLTNTIVVFNTDGTGDGASADDIAGAAVSSTSEYDLVGVDETGSLAGGTGNQVGVTDPGLGTLASNGGPTLTIALLTGSPAIAAGSAALAVDSQGNPLLYDQRGQGYPRSFGGNVDIGAFEASPSQQSQTIDFSAIAAQEYGASLTLNATASSGLPVSFTLISGPATLSGDVLTVTGVGTVDVEAAQAGNETFAAATPVDQSFTVNPAATNAIVASLVNPSVDGEYISFTVAIANASDTPVVPEGRVQFVVNGPSGTTDLGGPVTLTGGTATSPTVALAAGTDTVEASFSDPAGDFSSITGTLSGGQTVNTMTAQNLEIVLETTSTPTISSATNDDLQAIIAAVNGLPGQGTSVTITVDLGSGTFNDSTFSPPAGVTVVVIGNGTTTTFVGQSPAIVVTQGDVIISDTLSPTSSRRRSTFTRSSPISWSSGGRKACRSRTLAATCPSPTSPASRSNTATPSTSPVRASR